MNMMSSSQATDSPALPGYQDLRDRAETAFRTGQIGEAHGLFQAALQVARDSGDPVLIDRAVCNRAAVDVVVGASTEVLTELRSVLNHHLSDTNSWLAAYNLSMMYESRKEFKKGAFYARVADKLARTLRRAEWRVASLNQLGNCLLGDSLFEQATKTYEEAFEHLPANEERRRFLLLENLGYCAVCLGMKRKGLKLLYQGFRGIRRTSTFEELMIAHIDLSFALLETGRYRYSVKHAMAGLQLAEQHGYAEMKRNALYILGQASRLSGHSGRAAGFFHWLQEEFFPDSPEVSSFLHAVDVRPMLNLRA